MLEQHKLVFAIIQTNPSLQCSSMIWQNDADPGGSGSGSITALKKLDYLCPNYILSGVVQER
jgi:hypothetical protein